MLENCFEGRKTEQRSRECYFWVPSLPGQTIEGHWSGVQMRALLSVEQMIGERFEDQMTEAQTIVEH